MRKPPLQDVIVRSNEGSFRQPARRPAAQGFDGREEQYERASRKEERGRSSGVTTEVLDREEHADEFSTPNTAVRRPLRRRTGSYQTNSTNKKWLITALGIGAIVILSSVALSLLFAGATITVYPKQDSITLDAVLTTNATGEQNLLKFEKTVVERTVSEEVVALGEENVEERAAGNITIYNEYSETPQRVIKQTRFKTPEGLVFRVGQSVEIPGKKSDGTPGSIEVTVRAEEAGEEYNIPATSFTLPGYEEAGLGEHFEKIYARSTQPMEGGFVGIRRSVGDDVKEDIARSLETKARDELLSEVFESTDTPEGYYLSRDAVFFEFENLPDTPSGTDKVTISLKAKIHGILLPVDELESRLATFALSNFSDSPLRIENLEEISLVLSPNETEENERAWDASEYMITAQGKAHFIWEFDADNLATDFVAKDKDILNTAQGNELLENYPGIDRLEVNIRPFWKGTFPDSKDDILVITELDD